MCLSHATPATEQPLVPQYLPLFCASLRLPVCHVALQWMLTIHCFTWRTRKLLETVIALYNKVFNIHAKITTSQTNFLDSLFHQIHYPLLTAQLVHWFPEYPRQPWVAVCCYMCSKPVQVQEAHLPFGYHRTTPFTLQVHLCNMESRVPKLIIN